MTLGLELGILHIYIYIYMGYPVNLRYVGGKYTSTSFKYIIQVYISSTDSSRKTQLSP